ncbi:MAG: CotH kinase family protein [Verrucomicrobiales bacterium]
MTVADAAVEFSGVQGQDGWEYGYYDRSADLAAMGDGVYQTSEFTRFAGGAGQGAWNINTQMWTGSFWDRNTAAAAPWTSITASAMHPNDAVSPGPEEYAIRRWVSDVAGTHTVEGYFNNASASGDGTTGRVFHNGTEIYAVLTNGGIANYAEQVELQIGDTLDFMVDVGPVPGGNTDGSDGTNYAIKINEGSGSVSVNDTIMIPIEARVLPTVSPIASVTLHYRVMFDPEESLPMLDDGMGGDAAAGDGIYTAVITTDKLANGQMIRWRVSAEDSGGNTSQNPAFLDPLDSPQYFGTVAENPDEDSSRLTILHQFIENEAAANTDSGTRCAIFYLGQLYDNVQIDQHGQSTRSFGKKSYDLDFNKGDRFRWKEGERRVKDINLLSNYADKAKIRNWLAYKTVGDCGAATLFAFPVRVQRNGVFFGTSDMVEDGDDRWMERIGFDPEGALYKMYNTLNAWTPPGALRKTTKEEGTADLQAFVEGMDTARPLEDRLRYAYDNVNIPETINYFASMVLTGARDHGHKNYYLYRDTHGSGEWAGLAWDIDLSFGHNWTGGSGYFDDNIYADRQVSELNDLYAPGVNNRLKVFIYQTEEIYQLYARRVRTLMDELLQPPGTPVEERRFEAEILAMADLIDPPEVAVSDADLDLQKWGSWGNQDDLRTAVERLVNEDLGPTGGYFQRRRAYLYGLEFAPDKNGRMIPPEQPANPPVNIGAAEVNPSGGQSEEFIRLDNPNSYAVDISGWSLGGGVEMTFIGGTVIPASGSIYVAKHAPSFRARATSPTGGEKHIVVSAYKGQLSARGETITLSDKDANLVSQLTTPAQPTLAQQFLRIAELHYHPAEPTADELLALPQVTAEDFEFIELVNIGPDPLDISGAQFVEGVSFTFPAATVIAAGERILVVANEAAFALRYGAGLPMAGTYLGQLDNAGERLQLVDAGGEVILDFEYRDGWFNPTDGDGYSLEFIGDLADHTAYDSAPNWGISAALGGSPNAEFAEVSMTFEAFQRYHFTDEERGDPAVSGPAANLDGDALTLWEEYIFGRDHTAADTDPLATAGVVDVEGETYLTLTFRRTKRVLDATYILQWGIDLDAWNDDADPEIIAVIDHGDGTETVTLRAPLPIGGDGDELFLRLWVSGQ